MIAGSFHTTERMPNSTEQMHHLRCTVCGEVFIIDMALSFMPNASTTSWAYNSSPGLARALEPCPGAKVAP